MASETYRSALREQSDSVELQVRVNNYNTRLPIISITAHEDHPPLRQMVQARAVELQNFCTSHSPRMHCCQLCRSRCRDGRRHLASCWPGSAGVPKIRPSAPTCVEIHGGRGWIV